MSGKRKKNRLGFGRFLAAAVFILSIIANSNFAKAGDDLNHGKSGHEKLYKSIQIEYGDTLWEIAGQNKGSHYESNNEYIDEVMKINHLKTDKINAGQYLTIPYYNYEIYSLAGE